MQHAMAKLTLNDSHFLNNGILTFRYSLCSFSIFTQVNDVLLVLIRILIFNLLLSQHNACCFFMRIMR